MRWRSTQIANSTGFIVITEQFRRHSRLLDQQYHRAAQLLRHQDKQDSRLSAILCNTSAGH